jgi:hypothetical protein
MPSTGVDVRIAVGDDIEVAVFTTSETGKDALASPVGVKIEAGMSVTAEDGRFAVTVL